MKVAWMLPPERMPVSGSAAPQLRFARIREWLRELGFQVETLFEPRLRARGPSLAKHQAGSTARTGGDRRGTVRAALDLATGFAAAPWVALRSRRRRPDLIYSATVAHAPLLAVARRALGSGVTIVADCLGLRSLETEQTARMAAARWAYRPLWRRLERWTFANADVVLAVNERGAELIREISPEANVAVLRDTAEPELAGISTSSRSRWGIPEDAIAVGFAGSFVSRRLDRLLDVWSSMNHDGHEARLVLIGDGPDLARYRSRVEASSALARTVLFAGALPRREALALLRSCDIAYTGSWSKAGFSLKLFEYMALGMPIIVERRPQVEEVFVDGESAIFYSTPAELTTAISDLAEDPDLRRRLGRGAHQVFAEQHSLSTRGSELAEIVRDASVRRADPIDLLEVGVNWPPETFVGWRLQELAARGVQVTVATTARGSLLEPRLDGVRVLRVPAWGDPKPVKLWRLMRDGGALAIRDPDRLRRLLSGLRRHIPAEPGPLELAGRMSLMVSLARMQPDIVQFEWETAAIDCIPLFEVWGCPVVVSCHGAGVATLPHTARFGPRLRRGLGPLFAQAAAIHCVAESVREEAQRLGASPSKTRVIRAGVDPAAFSPGSAAGGDGQPDPDAPLRILSVARLVPTKGFEHALLAVRAVVDRGVPISYEIVGGEPRPQTGFASDLARIRYTIEDLGLGDRVRLLGRLPSSKVRRAMRNADLLLQASLNEGMPTVVAEAMACGLPVVATDCGGTSELVGDGEHGLLVPRRDPVALAEAVLRLWRDPELRRRLGDAGRARIESEFTLAAVADNFLELYRSLIESGTATPDAALPGPAEP